MRRQSSGSYKMLIVAGILLAILGYVAPKMMETTNKVKASVEATEVIDAATVSNNLMADGNEE